MSQGPHRGGAFVGTWRKKRVEKKRLPVKEAQSSRYLGKKKAGHAKCATPAREKESGKQSASSEETNRFSRHLGVLVI